jgi:hypothetical protein
MGPQEFLGQFPKHGDFSRKSKIVLFAYFLRKHRALTEFSTKDIRQCFADSLQRVPTNLPTLLNALAKGKDSPLLKGTNVGRYSLSLTGLNEVEAILPSEASAPEELSVFLKAAIPHLRKIITQVSDERRREFLAEAISCLGVQAKRATIVMVWIATIDHLYEHVVNHRVSDFQAALALRNDKVGKLNISNKDDFLDIREAVFIETCRSAKIISQDIRKVLDERLGLRNSCAHPGELKISDSKVVSYIEDLVDNVMAKYPI